MFTLKIYINIHNTAEIQNMHFTYFIDSKPYTNNIAYVITIPHDQTHTEIAEGCGNNKYKNINLPLFNKYIK